MSDADRPPPYPGPGRPAGPGYDPSSAPTQVGPPATPAGAAPPPPVVPPPLAPPPYGQQPWGPPPPQRRGSRVGLVVGLVVLVLLLAAGGGVAAFLVLRDDGESGAETSGSEHADDPDAPPSDEPRTLDPDAVEEDLSSVASEIFPTDTTQTYLTAHSWSVAADNLESGIPRDLVGGEREGATQWTVGHGDGDHTYSIYVEQLAPDYASAREQPGCNPQFFAGDFCEVHTTPASTTAYEQVYTYDTGGSRYLWVPGDPASGRPEVSVAESVSGQPEGTTTDEIRALFDLDVDAVLAALDDDRLQVPAPQVLPPLPSYQACSYLDSPPTTCPAGLE